MVVESYSFRAQITLLHVTILVQPAAGSYMAFHNWPPKMVVVMI
jgi:hypothetical protein